MSLKIELWAVLLIVLFGLLAMIGFGFAALDGEHGAKRFGRLSQTAHFLATMPDTIKAAMKPDTRMQVYDSAFYDGLASGWSSPSGAMPKLDGYLLFSRFDGSLQRPVVELISMDDWQIKHRWQPEADVLLQGFAPHDSKQTIPSNWDSKHYRAIHPYLMEDGQLIIKDHNAPLFSVNACGAANWVVQGKLFHHSTERDGDGNLWVPSIVEPPSIPDVPADFFEDNLVKLSPKGEVLWERSVPDMLMKSGLDYLLFTNGMYNYDPTHLNDIEPVMSDGPYWKKGDLFLSLRNISSVVLYRPSTDQIVWMKQGPWMSQHDVVILDDHRIAVFDNQAQDRGGFEAMVYDHSRVAIYDFATDKVSYILDDLMADQKVRALYAGLYSPLPAGYHMVEEVTSARMLIADPAGKLAAEFTNRADDGKIYQLGWTRFVSKSQGDAALAAMKGVSCND